MNLIKTLLISVPLSATLLSCSQQHEPADQLMPCHEVEFSLDFSLSSALSSRAGRPLESIDDWQHVDDMRVYVFRSATGEEGSYTLYSPQIKDKTTGAVTRQPYIYIPEFEKFAIGDEHGGIWKDDIDEQHRYTITPLLPDGYYRLFAVGHDDPASSPITLDWAEGSTNWDQLQLINRGDSPRVNEIFTGYPRSPEGEVITFKVSDNKLSFHTTIVLRRAVAGVLLCLTNIPATWTAEYGWYAAGGTGTGVISSDLDAGRANLPVYEVAVVSVGYNPVCDAIRRSWTGDFVYDDSRFRLTSIASISLDPSEATDGFYRGNYVDGAFVLPANLHRAKDYPLIADYGGGEKPGDDQGLTSFDKSLYLCFFTKTASGAYYPLKLWPIKLVRSYTYDDDQEDDCAGEVQLAKDDALHYNLVANHLYCLGIRSESNPEKDEYVDLEQEIREHPKDDLTITIYGSWQLDVNIDM